MEIDEPLAAEAGEEERGSRYRTVRSRLESRLEDEPDWVAAMATTVCALHRSFEYYDWTGFYRHVEPEVLVVGPYQGPSGSLRIPFSRGICGAAARNRETQFVEDVSERDDHIACSPTTRSEIVVPLLPGGGVSAVLDVDSDQLGAFESADREHLEAIADYLGERYAPEAPR